MITRTGVALLRIEQVSERTGVPVSTLRWWRQHGQGPKAARIGRRLVYRANDVEDWINAQFEESA